VLALTLVTNATMVTTIYPGGQGAAHVASAQHDHINFYGRPLSKPTGVATAPVAASPQAR
jgi:hypothetical protein